MKKTLTPSAYASAYPMKAINIILAECDNGPGTIDFVEIETDDGKSIRIGEYIKGDPYDKIRITLADMNDGRCPFCEGCGCKMCNHIQTGCHETTN